MLVFILLFLVGFFSLCKGGDVFVNSAVFFARKFNISEVIIGATILSIGTTLPELTVSVLAAAEGVPIISYGNVIGSVICNTALVGGVLCLLAPTLVSRREISLSSFFFCISAIICFIVGLIYGGIGTFAGLILIIVYLLSAIFTIKEMKKKRIPLQFENKKTHLNDSLIKQVVFLIFGVLMIMIGSRLLIHNGIRIAQLMNVPSHVIAVTFISFGTSLPELITAVVAIRKGHTCLSIGNLIGANIINLTMIIGISGMITPMQIPLNIIRHDAIFFIIILAVFFLPILFKKRTLRIQGIALLVLYIYYCVKIFI